MQLSVKLLVLYTTLALTCTLAYAAYHGRAYGHTADTLMLAHHRDGVLASALMLGLTVFFVEVVIYELRPPRSWLFAYHMPAALGMAAIFILMASWATGLRFPALHRRLSRAFFACLAAAATTGGIILVQM